MPPKISSIADMSSVLHEGRARVSEIADIPGMTSADWRDRLEKGIKDSGKSLREVSLAAGKGPGYVHSILKEGKDPTIDNLIKVCEAAGLSVYSVLYGVQVDRETEEIIQLLKDPDQRKGLLQVLKKKPGPEAA